MSRQIIDIFQPETTRIGGITELVKTSRMAEAHYIKVAPHDGSVGPVAEAANIQVCANLPNFIFLEHHGSDPAAPNADVPYRSEVVIGMVPDKDGYIEIPTVPGIGIDINEEECEKHPFQFRPSREIPLDDIFTSKPTYLDRS